jgi:hypothetical protein
MYLTSTFATASKLSPCLKEVQYSNAVHKDFSTTVEEQKPHPANINSIEVPDEEKNIPGTLALLKLAKWAQEQQFEWKGSPNVGINHDAYFIEAAQEALEAKRKVSEFEI